MRKSMKKKEPAALVKQTMHLETAWTASLQQELSERLDAIEQIINSKESAIAHAPAGGIRVLQRKDSFQVYYRKDGTDTNGVYLTKDKWKLAKALAQKEYDQKVLHVLKAERSILARYLKQLTSRTVEQIYDSYSEARRGLIEPMALSEGAFTEQWKCVTYEPMEFDEKAGEFYSNQGVRVRSKSEAMIASALEYYGVPYRYEYPLILKRSGQVRPDFVCLNVKQQKEVVWEHFGMMDNMGYANKNVFKLQDYVDSGYALGKNMIATFETSQHAISTTIIKKEIENHLL